MISSKTVRTVLVLFISGFTTYAFSYDCEDGTYPVRAHPRSDYFRNDGTYVSATQVSESCRGYRELKLPKIVFEQGPPKNWPHKLEKFRKWNLQEQQETQLAFNKLPKVLTHIGKISNYSLVGKRIPKEK